MSKLAQNLYEEGSQSSSSFSSVESASNSSQVDVSFDFLSTDSLSFVDSSIMTLALFNILWSVGVSFVLISNFFFYFKNYGDKNEERIENGSSYIILALNVWLRIIPLILTYSLFIFSEGVIKYLGLILFIIFSFIKWYFDIIDLCKKNDYFPWFDKFTKSLTSLLKLKPFKSKKNKKK